MIATTFGAYLRYHSLPDGQWERDQIAATLAANPDFDGSMLAIGMGLQWQAEGLVNSSIASAFSIGVILSRKLIRRGPVLAWLIPIGFDIGCLYGALLGLVAGIGSVGQGDITLGLGDWLLAAGLLGGVAALCESIFHRARSRPNLARWIETHDVLAARSNSPPGGWGLVFETPG